MLVENNLFLRGREREFVLVVKAKGEIDCYKVESSKTIKTEVNTNETDRT